MSDDATININGTSYPILCGFCNKPITLIGEADADSGQAGCIDCDNIDDVKEVGRMVTEYAKDEGQLMLNRLAQDTARKSKFMNFTGQTAHNKAHRFIVKFEI